jgi:anti-sigma factor ChrR (cupin superfamily)
MPFLATPTRTTMAQAEGALKAAAAVKAIVDADLATDLKTTLANVKTRVNKLHASQSHWYATLKRVLELVNQQKPSLISGGNLNNIYNEFAGNFGNGHF